MSEETKPLPLTCAALKITADQLEVEVKNTSGKALTERLWLEIQFPAPLVAQALRDAALAARISESPKSMVSLADVVTGGGGMSVWAYLNSSDDLVAVRLYNYRDQKTGAAGAATKIEAAAAFTLKVPLSKQDSSAEVTISYQCVVGQKSPVKASFTVKTTDAGEWTPKVTLSLNAENPTSLVPGTKVKIQWKIEKGVSATLRGPMPGGHSKRTLSNKPGEPYQLAEGELEIIAVGPATYILDAEVRRPGHANAQVIRTLMIDTLSGSQYSFLEVRPKPVLPNGLIKIDWAVWGVENASIEFGQTYLRLTLTEQDLSGTYSGKGTWTKQWSGGEEEIYLDYQPKGEKSTKIRVRKWEKIASPAYTGRPLGLAVAAVDEKERTVPMALLTTDGLFMASIDRDDEKEKFVPGFSKVATDTPKAWLALTAFEQGFVVLRQVQRDGQEAGLQLLRYNRDKTQNGPPVDLSFTKMVLDQPGATFTMAAFGERVYLIGELPLPGGTMREALSLRFDPDPHEVAEYELGYLRGYRLLSFAGALYAAHPASGHLYRFDAPDGDLSLDPPRKAKSAANGNQSLLRHGVMLPVGDTLVILGADTPSTLRTLELSDLVNVEDFSIESESPKKDENKLPQDLVYNPQKDEWTPCGQGLEIKPGAVAAYRGGTSPRLWVLQPGGALHTLRGAEEKLFAPDHINKLPPETLPPALSATRKFKITNSSGKNFLAMVNVPTYSGLESFSAVGYAEVKQQPFQLGHNRTETVEFAYHPDDPSPITLRYSLETTTSGISYVIEVIFSGPDLSSAQSVVKRVVNETPGQWLSVVTIDEVPGTRVQHPADAPIVIPPPRRLTEKAKLVILNATPHELMRDYPQRSIPAKWELPIVYDTLGFALHPATADAYRELGVLRFDINYALPDGVEVLSKGKGQSTFLRINPDEARGMGAAFIKMLKPGDPPVEVEYKDGKTTIAASADGPVYICQIIPMVRKELDAIAVGDPACNKHGDVYLPVALPSRMPTKEVWKLAPGTLERSHRGLSISSGGVFSPPNSIGVYHIEDKEIIFAMLGDSFVYDLDFALNPYKGYTQEGKRDFSDYTPATNMWVSTMSKVYVLGVKKQGNQLSPANVKSHYWLTAETFRERTRVTQLCLDDLRDARGQSRTGETPAWVSPTAISPLAISLGAFRAGIGIEGGVIVIDLHKEKVKVGNIERERIEVVSLDGTGRPEAVAFNYTTSDMVLYCAHSQPSGQGLQISRVNVKTLNDVKDKLTISLAPGEGSYEMVTDTGGAPPSGPDKRMRAISLAQGKDNSPLFVSHGRTITQIDTKTMKVVRRFTVELPCRVFHVREDGPMWWVYALGATYKGNGNNVEEYQTHLYKLGVLKSN